MSIKSIGLSLWNNAKSSSPSSTRRSSQSGPVPVGFGLPSPEDPDPFGVKALELAGLEIKEAGSTVRPSIDAFEYRPSPTSPVFRLSTQSIDLAGAADFRRNSKRHSKRNSKRSIFSLKSDPPTSDARNSISEERGSASESRSESRASAPSPTPPALPPRGPSPTSLLSSPTSLLSSPSINTFAIDAGIVQSPISSEETLIGSSSLKSAPIQLPETIDETIEEGSDEEGDDFDDDEDIVIEEVSTSAAPVVPTVLAAPIAVKAKVVSIKRRGPPALPLKSPLRPRFLGTTSLDDPSAEQDEVSSGYSLSPDKSAFDNSETSQNPWSEQTSLQDNESIRQKDGERDSLSISEHDDAIKNLEMEEGVFEDAKETTPIATKSDLTMSSTAKESPENDVAAISSIEATELTPEAETKIEASTSSSSEHKSSISGSTLASITDSETPHKSGSEQNLASLIKQNLSAGLADDDDYEENTLNYYYDADEASTYEDDAPTSPTSFEPMRSAPGSFEPQIIH